MSKLPPYTIPKADRDLWQCGINLSLAIERGDRQIFRELRREQYAVILLQALRKAGKPMRMRELSALLGLRPNHVIFYVRQLESRGLVRYAGTEGWKAAARRGERGTVLN